MKRQQIFLLIIYAELIFFVTGAIPESGITNLRFDCADQKGIFYVKVLEIKEGNSILPGGTPGVAFNIVGEPESPIFEVLRDNTIHIKQRRPLDYETDQLYIYSLPADWAKKKTITMRITVSDIEHGKYARLVLKDGVWANLVSIDSILYPSWNVAGDYKIDIPVANITKRKEGLGNPPVIAFQVNIWGDEPPHSGSFKFKVTEISCQ